MLNELKLNGKVENLEKFTFHNRNNIVRLTATSEIDQQEILNVLKENRLVAKPFGMGKI
jgi:hypothetical protein